MTLNSRIYSALGAAILALFGGAISASATTLTFDGVTDNTTCPVDPIVEQGIEISNCPASFNSSGTIHLDDLGTPYFPSVSFEGPVPFKAVQVDVQSLAVPGVAIAGLMFEGYSGAALVAEQFYDGGVSGIFSTVVFDPDFINLDKLTIIQVSGSLAGVICAPCAHSNIDNLVITPVPLPATGLLLLGALGGMGLWRRRRC